MKSSTIRCQFPRRYKKWINKGHRFGRRQRSTCVHPSRFSFKCAKQKEWFNEDLEDWQQSWDRQKFWIEYNLYGHFFGEICNTNCGLIEVLLLGARSLLSDLKRFQRCDWGFMNIEEQFGETAAYNRVTPTSVNENLLLDFQSVYYGRQDELPIVFDTGATIGLSPYASDFISWDPPEMLKGASVTVIAASTEVQGAGIVEWITCDDTGCKNSVKTRAFYIREARDRLLRKETQSGSFSMTPRGAVFTFPHTKHKLSFELSQGPDYFYELPVAYPVSPPSNQDMLLDQSFFNLNVLAESNINLSLGQKELMLWHFRLGHFHLEWIQRLLLHVQEGEADSVLPCKHKANTCSHPQCAACHYAKMKLRSTEETVERKVESKDGSLKAGN
jgi:hypothetical protein